MKILTLFRGRVSGYLGAFTFKNDNVHLALHKIAKVNLIPKGHPGHTLTTNILL